MLLVGNYVLSAIEREEPLSEGRESMTITRLVVCIATVASLIVLPAKAFGQAAQSGLSGVVKDSTGAVLPGVTVEAQSPALIEKTRVVTTDSGGLYRIVDLRPGIYTVTFSLPGFNTVRVQDFELRADFQATVNADMRVGELAETITVTGQAPLVDVQTTTRSAVYAKDVIDALPTNRQIQSLALTIPGVVGGVNIDGPASRNLTVHGSRGNETNSAIDGMSDRRGAQGGTAVTFYMNQGSVQEVSVRTDGGDAESQYAGVWMNAIPKEGGNAFTGSIIAQIADKSLSADNLTDEYIQRGLTAVNSLKRVWDFNPNGGGPLITDKLWFYGAYRNNEIHKYVADSFYSIDPKSWLFNPDKTRQATNTQTHKNYALRLTWQATDRNRINVSYEKDRRTTPHRRATALVSPEATTYTPFHPNAVTTVVWRVPVTSRLLLDTGFMHYVQDWDERRQIDPLVGFDQISVTEDSTGQIYRASTVYGHNYDNPITLRSSATYVSGAHNYKAGFMVRHRGNGPTFNDQSRNGDMTYNFLDQKPSRVTIYASPIETHNDLNADLGIFAQDSWTTRGMTINYGLRLDYLKASVPEQHLAAGRFVPERNFAAVKNVPNWKDINPRVGISYDLFKNGRTAVKGTVGRYITGGSLASNLNPVSTSVNNANRSWTDKNGDYYPQCDWANPASQLNNPPPFNECGSLSNTNFGKINPLATQYDKEVTEGWGKRPYNWSVSAGVQHQIASGLSVDVGYFRRWYGNFNSTDNVNVTPDDYSPYCVTAPSNDSRLPVAGQQICGFYDISVAARARPVQNQVRMTKHFGDQKEVYNGVDASMNWRVQGLTLFLSTNVGRTATSSCFVIDSPQVLKDCEVTPPFMAQYKAYGVYTLPWGVSLSGTFLAVPGLSSGGGNAYIGADYVATNAEIKKTLIRDLSAGANGTATVQLLSPYQLLGNYARQLDLRLGKTFSAGGGRRARLSLDIYNVFNSSDIQELNTRLSSNPLTNQWQRPTVILQARYFQLGTQIDF